MVFLYFCLVVVGKYFVILSYRTEWTGPLCPCQVTLTGWPLSPPTLPGIVTPDTKHLTLLRSREIYALVTGDQLWQRSSGSTDPEPCPSFIWENMNITLITLISPQLKICQPLSQFVWKRIRYVCNWWTEWKLSWQWQTISNPFQSLKFNHMNTNGQSSSWTNPAVFEFSRVGSLVRIMSCYLSRDWWWRLGKCLILSESWCWSDAGCVLKSQYFLTWQLPSLVSIWSPGTIDTRCWLGQI